MSEERVRAAFREQADACARLGSPFTAAVCAVLAEGLSSNDAVGRRVLTWPGDPAPTADNVPLRVAGALHALARSGRAPELAAAYPPHVLPPPATLAALLERVFREHADAIVSFLRFTPQTNEVGRSAVLIGGLLEIARESALPLALYEIGSSAGLNLLADRYRCRFGDVDWGPSDATLTLAPEWTGPPPPVDARLLVQARRGCDVHPIDIRDAAQRERLESYVWPDQPARLERLQAAIDTALRTPFALDRADAGDWVEAQLAATESRGIARVLFHSIAWTYLPQTTRARIEEHLARIGRVSERESPLAWLRFELERETGGTFLRLTTWPDGRERLLAEAHPHGTWVHWKIGP